MTLSGADLALLVGLVAASGAIAGFLFRGWLEGHQRRSREQRLGELRADLERRGGFRNTVRAPSLPQPSPARGADAAGEEGVPLSVGGRREPMVLMADDRPELLALHGPYLERHGYRVITATDGDSAVALARQYRPDVLLLDHTMPNRTGVEVARVLKGDSATADIPILLMTAHSYGAIGRMARAVGCDGFLPKPCEPGRVLQEVARHTARR
jgi:two-component system cell cycle response regulator DivK